MLIHEVESRKCITGFTARNYTSSFVNQVFTISRKDSPKPMLNISQEQHVSMYTSAVAFPVTKNRTCHFRFRKSVKVEITLFF